MRGKGKQKWRVGCGAIFKVCDLLESYDLACLLAELFLLADSQPTRHFVRLSPALDIRHSIRICIVQGLKPGERFQ